VQRQLEHAVTGAVADDAVCNRRIEAVEARAAGADDELADAFGSGCASGFCGANRS